MTQTRRIRVQTDRKYRRKKTLYNHPDTLFVGDSSLCFAFSVRATNTSVDCRVYCER